MENRLSYTRSEAAQMLGVCIETIKSWERKGILHPTKIEGRVLIPARELEALFDEREAAKEA